MLTSEGFGTPGGIPKAYEEAIRNFKAKRDTADEWRCPRADFVPFTSKGKIYASGREDGLPKPAHESPVFVFLNMVGDKIGAMAVLYLPKGTGTRVIKLEYLCGAPAARGKASELLRHIKLRKYYSPERPTRLILDDDSGKPGFYQKRGFADTGKRQHLHAIKNGRDSYNATIYAAPVRSALSQQSIVVQNKPAVVPKLMNHRRPRVVARPRCHPRAHYATRARPHPYMLRPRR